MIFTPKSSIGAKETNSVFFSFFRASDFGGLIWHTFASAFIVHPAFIPHPPTAQPGS
jgi:hypothetical protein